MPKEMFYCIFLDDVLHDIATGLSAACMVECSIQERLKAAICQVSGPDGQTPTPPLINLEKSLLSLASVPCTKGILYVLATEICIGETTHLYTRFDIDVISFILNYLHLS